MKEKATLLKLMGHEVRMELLKALCKGEHRVAQLEEITGKSQSTVSQSLAILRNAKIVQFRKEGTKAYYSIVNETVKDVIDALYK